jgi:multidrug resistance efflux pump
MSEFPLLSDERIEAVTKEISIHSLMARWKIARAIESESRAPLLAEIERLTEQVERLKADAERYKWLAAQHWVEPEAVFRLSLSDTDNSLEYMRELDAAIDAARAQGGE